MTALSEAPDRGAEVEEPDPLEVSGQERASRRIADDAEFDRVMRAAGRVARQRREIQDRAESLIAPIEEWATREDRKYAGRAEFLERLLEDYALRVRAADPRRKTLTTPFGDVSTAKQPDVWEFDEARALEWARTAHPDLVHRGEDTFAKAAAKKSLVATEHGAVVDANGLEIPWAKVTRGAIKATVRVKTGDDL